MNQPGQHEVARLHTDVQPTVDGCTVNLTGELDRFTGSAIADLLDTTAAGGARHIRVNLAQVSFCDLAGLRMLVHAYQRAAERGVALKVCDPPAHLVWLLQVTGTADQLLDGRRPGDDDEAAHSAPDHRLPPPDTTAALPPTSLSATGEPHVPETAGERECRADERDRRADDRELLDQERGRLLDERSRLVQEHQRWEDVREDLANIRERNLRQREHPA